MKLYLCNPGNGIKPFRSTERNQERNNHPTKKEITGRENEGVTDNS